MLSYTYLFKNQFNLAHTFVAFFLSVSNGRNGYLKLLRMVSLKALVTFLLESRLQKVSMQTVGDF